MKRESDLKKFSSSIDYIELSLIILIGFALLGMVLPVNEYIDKIIPSSIFGVLLLIFSFGTIGYKVAKAKLKPEIASRYGAYSGIVYGLFAAIIGIITFYFFPEKLAEAITQATQKGADLDLVLKMMKVGVFINVIILPAINAGLGAMFSWLGYLIFREKK